MIDDYYSGMEMLDDNVNERNILNSLVNELGKDPKRRITLSDLKIVEIWYTRASDQNKALFKKFVQNGQIEVANGGWGSIDQACPTYEDMLNNVMLGHQFMQKEFGVIPKVGWDMRAVGHSGTHARINAQLGYEGQFFSGVDVKLKDELMKPENKSMNFFWRP